jgi:hypothetical protein
MDSAQPCTAGFLHSKADDITNMLTHKFTRSEEQYKYRNQDNLMHLLPKWDPLKDPHEVHQQALIRRNKRNRRLNEEETRAIQVAERRKKKNAIKAAIRKRDEAARKAASGEDSSSQDSTPEQKEISRYIPRDYKKGLKDFTRLKTDDDIIAEMDFDIDIDIGL